MVAAKTTVAKTTGATTGGGSSSGSKKGAKPTIAKKTGVGAAGRQPGMKRTTTSSQAKLCLPVARLLKYIKKGRYADNVSKLYVVSLTGILEFVTAELLLAGIEKARARGRKRVTPRDLMLAVKDDEEFSFLLKNVQIAESGVVPRIHDELRSRKALSKLQEVTKEVAPGSTSTGGAKPKGSLKGTKAKAKQPVDDVDMGDEPEGEEDEDEVGEEHEDEGSDEDAEMEEDDEKEETGKGREISQDY